MFNKPSRRGVRGTLGGGRLTNARFFLFETGWGAKPGSSTDLFPATMPRFPKRKSPEIHIRGLLDKMLGTRILVLYLKDLTLF